MASAFSPDGRFIISASKDKSVRIWNIATGEEMANLPLPGSLTSLGLHTFTPRAVCGDRGGAVYRFELAGLTYGPIIITAARGEQGIEALCPACQNRFQIEKESLDNDITCPYGGCNTQLKINPFVIQPFQG
jgi:WD40 repeat protein